MPNEPSVPAVLYAAKSTEDRHASIPDQLARSRAFAERQDWRVVEEFSDEGFSAYSRNRGPGLERAKALAIRLAEEEDRCLLVALHSDRIARGAGDAPDAADHLVEVVASLRRHGVSLRTVEDDFFADDRIGLLMAAVMGQRNTEDSRRKSESVAAGFRRRAEQRGRHSGPAPFGYRRAEDSNLVVIAAEAEMVRRVFAEHLAGRSMSAIARALQADGVRTKHGARYWRQAQISGILRNPVYIGKVRYKEETFDGVHEAIVATEDWERVHQLLAAMPVRPGRPLAEKRHLFSGGFLRCAACGDPMVPNRRRSVDYEFYECMGRAHGCKTGAVRRRDVDEAVFAYFEQIALDVEATREQMRTARNRGLREAEALLASAEEEARESARQLDRIRRDYMKGELSAADWQEFKGELGPEIEAAEAQAARLRDRAETIASESALGEVEEKIAEQLAQLRAAIAGDVNAAADLDAVRAVLRRLFDSFLFHKDQPDDAHVELIGDNYWIEPVVSERAIEGYDEDMRPIIEPQPLGQAENRYKQPSGWL